MSEMKIEVKVNSVELKQICPTLSDDDCAKVLNILKDEVGILSVVNTYVLASAKCVIRLAFPDKYQQTAI